MATDFGNYYGHAMFGDFKDIEINQPEIMGIIIEPTCGKELMLWKFTGMDTNSVFYNFHILLRRAFLFTTGDKTIFSVFM